MTIIRNGIGSSANNPGDMLSILRQAPTINGTISAKGTPKYTWNGNDNGQVAFTKAAQAYGNITVIADAWSAPPFMKTNNNETHGGYICGVVGQDCETGDWRQAYADYLVQYVKFYEAEGNPIAYIGFVNEPDLK
jgi:O-glycosyl hydrolase